ncbi:MAG: VCBS domain-containing protein, partial [Burkholderiales bacterium]|nr:VCBS domain-containing protein [Burkholderiales bacterium]
MPTSTATFTSNPQAKDDLFTSTGLTEDSLSGVKLLDVIGNDLGTGNTLYSLADAKSESEARSKALSTQDAVGAVNLSTLGAKIWITAEGKVAYDASAISTAQFQSLAAGQSATDSFTYAIKLSNGMLSWATAKVQITGSNDAPVIDLSSLTIDGDSSSGKVTGTLLYTDPDKGDQHSASKALSPLVSSAGSPNLSTSLAQALRTTINDEGENGKGALKWNFALPSGTPKLATGQAVLANYQLSIADNHGGNSAAQDIGVLLVGTGATPKVYSVAARANLTEQAGRIGSTALDQASGTLSGNELGLEDKGALTSALVMTSWSTGAAIPSAAATVLASAITTSTVPTSKGGESEKSIAWQFSAQDKTFDFLAAGQTLTLAYRISSSKEEDGKSKIITVTVTGTNDAPVITNTSAALVGAAKEDTTLSATGQLSVSDVDQGATQTWSVQGSATGTYGAIAVNATGKWTYALTNTAANVQALAAGETHTETFTVRVTDDQGAVVDQSVTVTLTGTNDAPVVTNTSAALLGIVKEDTTLTVSGQLSASDVDHGATQAWSVQGSATGTYGSIAVDASGKWTYALDNTAHQNLAAGETQTETFTVRVTDDQGAAVDQTVTVTVNGTNDAPAITNTAAALVGAVKEDATLTATGQLSASDVDHGATQTWSVQGAVVGSYGSLAVGATGQWIYSLGNTAHQNLAAGESHDETFTVRVTDDQGATVDQTVTVKVTGTNDAPVITNSSTALAGAVTEDTSLSATGQLSASDVDHGATQAWSVQGAAVGSYGSLVVNATGQWTYSLDNTAHQNLAAGESHDETFTVRVTDDQGAVVDQTVIVKITGTNDVPVITNAATALVGAVKEDATPTATGQLSASDVDNGATQAWSIVGNAAGTYGSLGVDAASGQWTYTLNNAANVQALADGQSKSETFTVRVTDDQGAFVNQQVSVVVNGTNDAPIVAATDVTGAVTEQVTPAGNLTDSGTITFTDVDLTDVHSISAVTPSAGALGALTASLSTDTTGSGAGGVGSWNYSVADSAVEYLAAGQTKVETFSFNVLDGQGGSVARTVDVTVTGTNDAPLGTATATLAAGTEDTAYIVSAVNLLTGFSDVDAGDRLSLSGLAASNGTVTANANGTFTITPTANFNGPVTLNYNVVDSQGASVAATQTYTLTAVNDAPTILFSGQGGTITTLGSDIIHSYTNLGGDQFIASGVATTAQVLVVGGGGGGGAGGGGAGGVLYNTSYNLTSASQHQVSVGTGGTGGSGATLHALVQGGTNGSSSSFDTIAAFGGGGGGGYKSAGLNGASSGGAGQDTAIATGAATQGYQGANGAANAGYVAAGGGGGAGGVGTRGLYSIDGYSNPSPGGDGGNGLTNSITGASTYYGGGGGGGVNTNAAAATIGGVGGLGGGGAAARANFGQGSTGAANTGGGGGGGDAEGSGGAGGSGTVVVRYTLSTAQYGNTDSASASFSDTAATDVFVSASGLLLAADTENSALTFGVSGGTVSGGLASKVGVYGTLVINTASGSHTFTPNNASINALTGNASESFVLTASDGVNTSSGTYSVAISGANDLAAISGTSTGTVKEDTTLATSGALTVSDVDGGQAHTQAISGQAGAYGAFSVDANGNWTYALGNAVANVQALAAGTTVTETFTVKSQDGTASKNVTVAVTGTNDALTGTATAVLAAGTEDTAYTVSATNLLTGFSDVDAGDTMSVSGLAASNGTVTANANGTFTITPTANFNGAVTLSYNVIDGHGGSVAAAQSYTLAAVNDAPVAVVDSVSTHEDTATAGLAATLIANDSDADGDTLTITAVANATNGSIALNGGNPIFTPTANFSGPASFSYTISDGHGGTATATATVNVAPVADMPSLTLNGTTASGNVGTVIMLPLMTALPSVDTDGSESLRVVLSDFPVGTTFLGGQLNADGITWRITSAFGVPNLATQPLQMTLPAGYNGTFTLHVQAATLDQMTSFPNSQAITPMQDIIVTVAPVNVAPVAVADTLAATEDTPVTYTAAQLLGNDTDVDNTNAQLSIASVTSGTGGTAVLNAGGTVTFTPSANFNGPASFTYKASDGAAQSNSATVTMNVAAVNDAPAAVADTLSATEDTQVIYTAAQLLGNDTDVDNTNAQLSIASVTSGTGGTAVLNGNGTVTFTPSANFNGPAGFTYTARDGSATSNSATVTVNVAAVNDNPTVTAGAQSVQLVELGVVGGTASANRTLTKGDVDSGDTAVYDGAALTTGGWATSNGGSTYTMTGTYGTATLTAGTNVVSYALDNADTDTNGLAANAGVSDPFTVYVKDGSTGTVSTAVNFAITGTNDAPTNLALSANTIVENLPGATIGLLSASDPDAGATLTYTIRAGFDGAVFVISGDELRVGSAGLDYEASPTRTVTVRATDNNGAFVDSDFAINVVDRAEATLTTGTDIVAASIDNTQILGFAATLNPADSLDGGAGTDSLVLYGSGTFNLRTLAGYAGMEQVQLVNFTGTQAELYLRDNTTTEVTSIGSGATLVHLQGTALASNLIGGDGSNVYYFETAGSASGVQSINGGAGFDTLDFRLANTTFDLQSPAVTNVEQFTLNASNVTLLVDADAIAGVTSMNGSAGSRLVTAGTALDLSNKSVSTVTVQSTNATGTVFMLNNSATAFQVFGGLGSDTIQAPTVSFTADQRDAIFATASIETIIDTGGTWLAPPLAVNTYKLTAGTDILTLGATDDTINGNSVTLNSIDSLNGGGGTDKLALYGGGTFNLRTLAGYTGVEQVQLVNYTSVRADLVLRDSTTSIVTASGTGSIFVRLQGTSAASSIQGGDGGDLFYFEGNGTASSVLMGANTDQLYVWNIGAWNPTMTIDGGNGTDYLLFYMSNAIVDLRSANLSNVELLYAQGSNLAVQIDADAIANVTTFTGVGGSRFATADAALDLTNKSVSGGVTLQSTNVTGTTFTVNSNATASQVFGGPGSDTIQATGFTFTAAQRDAIFATASIEAIVDSTGTTLAPPLAANTFKLTAGTDILTGGLANETFNASAATLASTDKLDGGGGTDTLALYGGGTFQLGALAGFTNIEQVQLVNYTNSQARLDPRDGTTIAVTS